MKPTMHYFPYNIAPGTLAVTVPCGREVQPKNAALFVGDVTCKDCRKSAEKTQEKNNLAFAVNLLTSARSL